MILTLALLLSSQLTAAPASAGDPDDLLVKSFGGFGPDGSGSVPLLAGIYHGLAIQADGKYMVAGGKQADFLVARYNADGSLDTTFGPNGTGKVTTDFNKGSIDGIAIQPNGRIVVAGYSDDDFAIARYLSNGNLDNSFNEVGRAIVDYDGGEDAAQDLALQPDGKIVVGGYGRDCDSNLCEDENFVLVRLNANGSPDNSFDGDGLLFTDFGTNSDRVRSLAIQADGKIVAVGGFLDGDGSAILQVARYNSDGSPDTTLNSDGTLANALGIGVDVAVQPDSKLVVVCADGKLIRFNPNGSPDGTFGILGALSLSTPAGTITPKRVVLQSNDTILVAGTVGDSTEVALARYTASGQLDTRFGGGAGYATFNPGESDIFQDSLRDIAVTQDGQIVLLHKVLSASHYLTRIFPNGSLDDGGRVITNVQQGQTDEIRDVIWQPDGKAVAVGYYHHPGGSDHMTLARYRSDGMLDLNFGANGFIKERVIPIPSQKVDTYGNALALDAQGRIMVAGSKTRKSTGQTDFAVWGIDPGGSDDFFQAIDLGGDETAQAIAVQPDSKIVVAGQIDADQLGKLYFIARFNADGTPDESFAGAGYTFGSFDNQSNPSSVNALAVQPDGKIVVAGWRNSNGNYSFGVARYLADGSPDSDFGESDGKITTNLGPTDIATDLALLADGKILVSGHGGVNGNQMIVARYTAAGQLDRFGPLGLIVADFGLPARAYGLTLAGNGDIIVAGCTVGSAYQFALARFKPSGQPDMNFSGDGKATFTISNNFECAHGLAQNPVTGNLLLAGYAEAGPGDLQFALAQVQGTGPLPPPPPGGGGGSGTVYLPLVLK